MSKTLEQQIPPIFFSQGAAYVISLSHTHLDLPCSRVSRLLSRPITTLPPLNPTTHHMLSLPSSLTHAPSRPLLQSLSFSCLTPTSTSYNTNGRRTILLMSCSPSLFHNSKTGTYKPVLMSSRFLVLVHAI